MSVLAWPSLADVCYWLIWIPKVTWACIWASILIQPRSAAAYDVLVDPTTRLDDALMKDVRPGLDVLPSTVDLAGAEVELTSAADPHGQLAKKIAAAERKWDVVILDCPPSLGHLTMNALVAAHEVFVPMQAHFLALQGVGRLLETVGRVVRSVNQQLQVTGIILCMHEKQTTLGREIESDLEQFLESTRDSGQPWSNCRVLRPAIRRNIKLAEAPSFGPSIFDYAPTCPGAVDYRRLAEGLSRDWVSRRKVVCPSASACIGGSETKSIRRHPQRCGST